MDEPVKVKYVPVDIVKKYRDLNMWLTADFDEMVEKYGIDVVRYKQTFSIRDTEMNAIKACTDWMTVEEYLKECMSSRLDDCDAIAKHAKCTDKSYYPEMHATEYRYDIMIGEIPKWQQKGEEDAKS